MFPIATGRYTSTTFASGITSSSGSGIIAATSNALISRCAWAAALFALVNWVRLRLCSLAAWVSPKPTFSTHSAVQR
ncbi:Uncharacterised protein [Vibrio cholerae]|nr:Uncharacterised protein [Vibrio cholerae]